MNPQLSSLCFSVIVTADPVITVIHGELVFRLQPCTPRHGPELITTLVVCFASSIRRYQLAIAQMAYLVDLLSSPSWPAHRLSIRRRVHSGAEHFHCRAALALCSVCSNWHEHKLVDLQLTCTATQGNCLVLVGALIYISLVM